MYEANGSNLRKNPYQLSVSLNDFSMNKINSSNIEYRITDATKVKKINFGQLIIIGQVIKKFKPWNR